MPRPRPSSSIPVSSSSERGIEDEDEDEETGILESHPWEHWHPCRPEHRPLKIGTLTREGSIRKKVADTFAPERWEFLAQKGVTSKDMLHFGFGHGPRFCPGRFLGLLEVGLVVGALVKIFKFRAVGARTTARAGVSTKPADGVLVDLELRA